MILVSLGITLTGITVEIIIDINGAIVSFFFIYVIPISLHLKCVYFTPGNRKSQELHEEVEKPADAGNPAQP